MIIKCKNGVWFKFIDYRFWDLAEIFYYEYQKELIIPTVTSAADGHHSERSFHPHGLGWDWRIWGLKNPAKTANRIRKRARQIDPRYDIVFGDKHHLDHIHTEYDTRKDVGQD